MYRILLLVCLSVFIVSCQPQPLFPSPEPTAVELTTENDARRAPSATTQVVNARLRGQAVSIVTRADWDSLEAEDSILLAEKRRYIDETGADSGMLINIFQPHVIGYDVGSRTDNHALAMLHYIVDRPNYVGNASLVPPRGFRWGNHDAAFYTLYKGEGRYTLVIAVNVATSEDNLVVNVSVPAEQRTDLRDQLVDGLRSITVSDVTLTGRDLAALPDPIPFPSGDLEIATDNTPETP